MPAKVNRIIIPQGDNAGPRQFCSICKRYYVWGKGIWFCPDCGTQGTAEDVKGATKKVLKADTLQPFVGNKKSVKKQEDTEDMPEGARWVNSS